MPSDATVIERHRADIATALHEAENFGIVGAAAQASR
jgi:hypothetical protein